MANCQSGTWERNWVKLKCSVSKSNGNVRPEIIKALLWNVMVNPMKRIGGDGRRIVNIRFVSILREQRPKRLNDRLMKTIKLLREIYVKGNNLPAGGRVNDPDMRNVK